MRIVIVSMLGVGNLGDDLISVILVNKLIENYPDSEIGVLTYKGTNDIPYSSDKLKLLYYPQFSDPKSFIQRRIVAIKFISNADYLLIGEGIHVALHSGSLRAIITCF